MKSALAKLDRFVGNVLLVMALTCFCCLFVILLGNLAARLYGMGNVMGWYTEVAEILFGWMVMCSASILCRKRGHFRVDLLEMKYGHRRGYYLLDFLTNLAALLFFVALLYYGVKLTWNATQTMPVLHIERFWAYLCVPFNAFFLCVYTLRDAIRSLNILTGREPLPAPKATA